MADDDGTGELRAELARLREREARHVAYFAQAPHAIYVVDADGVHVDANPAACRQSGYALDELVGLPVAELCVSPRCRDNFERLVRDGRLSVEEELRRKDGSTFVAMLEAVRIGPDRFMASATDVTDRKASEVALREALDRAQGYLETVEAIIVALDVEGRITLLNRKGCDVLGYREDELLGACWFATCLPQPEGMTEVYPYFARLLAGEVEPIEYFENPVLTRRGEIRDIAWHNTLLRDRSGRIVGALAAGEDITERKRLEQQLQQTQKLEALGTLAGGIAHDMNNVLAMIVGFASLAEGQLPADHAAREDIQTLISAANRGKALVENLLGFARKGNYQKSLMSVDAVVERLVAVLEKSLSKQVSLVTDLAGDGCVIRGDGAQIAQILMNLCINAADAIEEAGAITIRTRVEDLETGQVQQLLAGRYVRIDVEDDGAGMSDEVRARALEPFFTTKPVGKGTGLGLSMAYGVVINHHGALSIDSSPGRGTTVTLRFPAVDGGVPDEAPARSDDAPRRVAGTEATVLVVDDEATLRRIFCRLLSTLGYRALAADSGQAAIELYRARGAEIDLVLLDLWMPGLDGAACFAALQALDPAVRVLLCTGHGAERDTDALLGRGAVGILRKPFDPDRMAEQVAAALALRPAAPS